MPPEIDLFAIERGSITAPAGCGKTQLIAETLIPGREKDRYQDYLRKIIQAGFPFDLARTVAGLPYTAAYLDIIAIANDLAFPVKEVGTTYSMLAEAMSVTALMHLVNRAATTDHWDLSAQRLIVRQLEHLTGAVVRSAIATKKSAALEAVTDFLSQHHETLERYHQGIQDLHDKPVTFSALFVLVHQLESLVQARPA